MKKIISFVRLNSVGIVEGKMENCNIDVGMPSVLRTRLKEVTGQNHTLEDNIKTYTH